ncbi:unnamed protein product [Angiostrongylus costaricensis]|uniref:Clathrin assembly protein n=1 Tax=Angiostrongylus costaricensis TaxID=334426 RepID=A0A0R3PPX6_ANGCS|nr:unnamed protein product [Angiostrongylus costaricensis]
MATTSNFNPFAAEALANQAKKPNDDLLDLFNTPAQPPAQPQMDATNPFAQFSAPNSSSQAPTNVYPSVGADIGVSDANPFLTGVQQQEPPPPASMWKPEVDPNTAPVGVPETEEIALISEGYDFQLVLTEAILIEHISRRPVQWGGPQQQGQPQVSMPLPVTVPAVAHPQLQSYGAPTQYTTPFGQYTPQVYGGHLPQWQVQNPHGELTSLL